MCLECHDSFSARDVMEAWKKLINDDKFFSQANTSTVRSMIYSMCGHDIDPDDENVVIESKKYSTRVFENFMRWYKINKYDRYFPCTGMETMYSMDILNKVFSYITENQDLDQEKLMEGCMKILAEDQKKGGKHYGQILEEQRSWNRKMYYISYFFTGVGLMGVLMDIWKS
jgi:hypothetical protein